MTTRDDVKVLYYLNPRLILVEAPSININIQDLHDTLSVIDEQFTSMSYPHLLSTAGKEDLGGGNFVGLTLTLQNAQIGFGRRTNLLSTGTITTASIPIIDVVTVTDAAATFITDGVERGDLLINVSDGAPNSFAEVVTVLSETQLEVLTPTGGAENDYDVGDTYNVWEVIDCSIDGGNLVAVDELGSTISPTFPTFGTYITRILSSSGTLVQSEVLESEITNLRKLWRNRQETNPSTGVMTVYDDDNVTPLFTAPVYEDVAGTQQYQGNGIDRRDRLT